MHGQISLNTPTPNQNQGFVGPQFRISGVGLRFRFKSAIRGSWKVRELLGFRV